MTNDELVARVARAMVAADSGPEDSALFDIHWSEFGDGYKESARAAISTIYDALQEPSEEMRIAGAHVHDQRPSEVAAVFKQMLTASPLNGGK